MVSFPVFRSLAVDGYGLFPGETDSPGLQVNFAPGLTLFLGANGLGKTTTVTMLFRLLTGLSDIPALSRPGALGTATLRVSQLGPQQRRAFSRRVADGAKDATARLVFNLGGQTIIVQRSLVDLRLLSFRVAGTDLDADEETYKSEISRLAGVSDYGDWILILRYIVFYFEDRRSLVWDPSAQTQLLRLLFLDPDHARRWTREARVILEMDSRARNLGNALQRQRRDLASREVLVDEEVDVREELATLEELQTSDGDALSETNDILTELASLREDARMRVLTREQERESTYRELEHAKLISIDSRLPRESDSARYILAQLLVDADCLVCGTHVPAHQERMEARMRDEQCVVCGSTLVRDILSVPSEIADQRVGKTSADFVQIEVELEAARVDLGDAEQQFASTRVEAQQRRADVAARQARINELIERLPPEEAQVQSPQGASARWRLQRLVGRESRPHLARSAAGPGHLHRQR